jgi:hypothetical protein
VLQLSDYKEIGSYQSPWFERGGVDILDVSPVKPSRPVSDVFASVDRLGGESRILNDVDFGTPLRNLFNEPTLEANRLAWKPVEDVAASLSAPESTAPIYMRDESGAMIGLKTLGKGEAPTEGMFTPYDISKVGEPIPFSIMEDVGTNPSGWGTKVAEPTTFDLKVRAVGTRENLDVESITTPFEKPTGAKTPFDASKAGKVTLNEQVKAVLGYEKNPVKTPYSRALAGGGSDAGNILNSIQNVKLGDAQPTFSWATELPPTGYGASNIIGLSLIGGASKANKQTSGGKSILSVVQSAPKTTKSVAAPSTLRMGADIIPSLGTVTYPKQTTKPVISNILVPDYTSKLTQRQRNISTTVVSNPLDQRSQVTQNQIPVQFISPIQQPDHVQRNKDVVKGLQNFIQVITPVQSPINEQRIQPTQKTIYKQVIRQAPRVPPPTAVIAKIKSPTLLISPRSKESTKKELKRIHDSLSLYQRRTDKVGYAGQKKTKIKRLKL